MKITTDNKPRCLMSWHEIDAKSQPDFDYIDDDDRFTARFVKYKGEWYDAIDTQAIRVSQKHHQPMGWAMYVEPDDPLAKWHVIITESYFSGIVFRFVDDLCVIVGRYCT